MSCLQTCCTQPRHLHMLIIRRVTDFLFVAGCFCFIHCSWLQIQWWRFKPTHNYGRGRFERHPASGSPQAFTHRSPPVDCVSGIANIGLIIKFTVGWICTNRQVINSCGQSLELPGNKHPVLRNANCRVDFLKLLGLRMWFIFSLASQPVGSNELRTRWKQL